MMVFLVNIYLLVLIKPLYGTPLVIEISQVLDASDSSCAAVSDKVEDETSLSEGGEGETNSNLKGECPPGWRSLNGNCFYVSTDFDETHMTWPEAMAFCTDWDASLAEPTTINKVKEIADLVSGDGNRWGNFWVGATNGNTATFSWVLAGEEVSEGWRSGQPSTTDPDRCVAIIWADSDTGLEVWRCSNHGRFICQAPQTQADTTTTTMATTTTKKTIKPVECDKGYSGLIPDPANCQKYYKCHYNVVPAAHESCPSGNLYDTTTKNCNWAVLVDCGGRPHT